MKTGETFFLDNYILRLYHGWLPLYKLEDLGNEIDHNQE